MQFTEEKPIWRQIYDLIAMRILSGEWAEMERIVSVREMAAAVGVNPNTVMRSYEKLEADFQMGYMLIYFLHHLLMNHKLHFL